MPFPTYLATGRAFPIKASWEKVVASDVAQAAGLALVAHLPTAQAAHRAGRADARSNYPVSISPGVIQAYDTAEKGFRSKADSAGQQAKFQR